MKITKYVRNTIAIGAAFLALAVVKSPAQSVLYAGGDQSVAIRIYNGYTGSLSVACLNAGSNFTIVANGLASTIAVTAFTNAASLAAQFAAVTDHSGRAYAMVDLSGAALPTDTMVGKLVAASNTVSAGQWIRFYWKTSLAGFYQVGMPKGVVYAPGSTFNPPDPDRANVGVTVKKIYGQPSGTGTVTTTAYIGTSVVYQTVSESPVYVLGAGNTNVASTAVTLNLDTSIPIGPTDPLIIRSTRATSALPATGNIGATLQPHGL